MGTIEAVLASLADRIGTRDFPLRPPRSVILTGDHLSLPALEIAGALLGFRADVPVFVNREMHDLAARVSRDDRVIAVTLAGTEVPYAKYLARVRRLGADVTHVSWTSADFDPWLRDPTADPRLSSLLVYPIVLEHCWDIAPEVGPARWIADAEEACDLLDRAFGDPRSEVSRMAHRLADSLARGGTVGVEFISEPGPAVGLATGWRGVRAWPLSEVQILPSTSLTNIETMPNSVVVAVTGLADEFRYGRHLAWFLSEATSLGASVHQVPTFGSLPETRLFTASLFATYCLHLERRIV